MRSTLQLRALEPLRSDPRRAAVLLDIDGTLAPIVEHAEQAHVPETTRQPLISISRRYGLVACVSGRRALDARSLVSIGTISYVGSHGAELLRGGWTAPELDPEVARWTAQVQEFAQQADTAELRRHRVRLEDKGAICAFHWRGAPDQERAYAAVQEVAAAAELAGLRPHWGRKVLELRPPVSIDKGAGVNRLLDGAAIGNAIYVGDDRTDLDAFRALRHLVDDGRLASALTVGVLSDDGPPEIAEQADVTVDGPDGVRELLVALVAD